MNILGSPHKVLLTEGIFSSRTAVMKLSSIAHKANGLLQMLGLMREIHRRMLTQRKLTSVLTLASIAVP